jgi:hypothetical protein
MSVLQSLPFSIDFVWLQVGPFDPCDPVDGGSSFRSPDDDGEPMEIPQNVLLNRLNLWVDQLIEVQTERWER